MQPTIYAKVITKFIVLFLFLTFTILLNAQDTITVRIDSINVCQGGSIAIPVHVENFIGVSVMALVLDVDPAVLLYSTVQNVNPELLSGFLQVSQVVGSIHVNYFNPATSVNIPDGILFELVFNSTCASSPLNWDTVGGGCIIGSSLPSFVTYFKSGWYECFPFTTVISGPVEVCEYETTVFYSTPNVPGNTYNWVVSGGVITAGQGTNQIIVNWGSSGTGVLFVTETNIISGCSTTTASYNVSIQQPPVVNLGNDTTIFYNNTLTLDAGNPGCTYQWSTGETTISIICQATSDTIKTYSVEANSSNNCIDRDTIIVTFDTCLSSFRYHISGFVTYDDMLFPHQPISNTLLKLYNTNGNLVSSTYTHQYGYYQFNFLTNGTYYIETVCTKPWGGGNSSDALAIMRHFAGLNILTGLHQQAADVDLSAFVSTLDALYISQRFVGMITNFPANDWIFENNTITINGGSVIYNIKGLCYGDVDGSYIIP